MSRHRRIVHAVYKSDEFNALPRHLRRAVRRTVEPDPPGGARGLIVEIVSGDNCTQATVCAHVPPATDVTRETLAPSGQAHQSARMTPAPLRHAS
jgi:hypothetical protein